MKFYSIKNSIHNKLNNVELEQSVLDVLNEIMKYRYVHNGMMTNWCAIIIDNKTGLCKIRLRRNEEDITIGHGIEVNTFINSNALLNDILSISKGKENTRINKFIREVRDSEKVNLESTNKTMRIFTYGEWSMYASLLNEYILSNENKNIHYVVSGNANRYLDKFRYEVEYDVSEDEAPKEPVNNESYQENSDTDNYALHPLINPESKHYNNCGVNSIELLERMYTPKELSIWSEITAMKYALRVGRKNLSGNLDESILSDVHKKITYENYYNYLIKGIEDGKK